jgi:hypothetical protein
VLAVVVLGGRRETVPSLGASLVELAHAAPGQANAALMTHTLPGKEESE